MIKLKKMLILICFMTAALALTGCGKDPVEINYNEFVDTPTNLAVNASTKKLTWSSVDNATGYVVYVDGEALRTTTETSFDFSSYISEDVIIFRVSALAPKGMQDSTQSVSIAYNDNPAGEKSGIQTVLSMYGFDGLVSSEFVDELVNKGVTDDDMLAFITAYRTFILAFFSSFDDPLGIIESFDDFVAKIDNIEAFVSAIVLTELVPSIESDIEDDQNLLDYYMGFPASMRESTYKNEIETLTEDIAVLENALGAVNGSFDNTVLSITKSMEYMLTIFTETESVITEIINIYNNGISGFEDFNPDEFIVIKDELVSVLRENEPDMSECVLLFETMNTIGGVFSGIDLKSDEYASLSDTKFAAEMVISYQLMIEYIDSIDLEFLNEFKTLGLTYYEDQPEMFKAEASILYLEHLDTFMDENQDMIDQMDEVFTSKEKQSVYEFYLAYLAEANSVYQAASDNPEYADEISEFIANFGTVGFETLDAINAMGDTCFEKALDYFVKTDGEILRLLAIYNGFYSINGLYGWKNTALDVTYGSSDEFRMAVMENEIQILDQILGYIDVVAGEISDDDIEALAYLVQTFVPYDTIATLYNLDSTEIEILKTDIYDLLVEQLPNVVELLDNLGGYEKFYNVIGRLASRIPDWDGYFENGDENYVLMIYLLDYYKTFMNSGNQELIGEIKTAVFETMRKPEVIAMLSHYIYDVDEKYIDDMETSFDQAFAFSLSEAKAISKIDKDNMTVADRERIDEYFETIENYFIS